MFLRNKLKYSSTIIFALVFLLSANTFAQDIEQKGKDEERPFMKYLSWTLLQAVPSPVLNQDANETDSRLSFGLRWNIVPINFSFNANKFVSPVQFFMVNPVRRYTGSIELFVQPEVSTAGFDYAGYDNFAVGTGLRYTFPINHYGEHLAGSIGAKWNYRHSGTGADKEYYGIEGGLYILYGIFGIQGNYNFNDRTRYNISLNFKYF